MLRARFRRMNERRVTLLAAAFFLALAVPGVLLLRQAYGQLELQAFRQAQQLAEELAARIDADLRGAVAAEEDRPFGDYSFLAVAGDQGASFVQRSPLAAFPVTGALPGTIGYFQVDNEGAFTTPLLPSAGVDVAVYGVGAEEEAARRALEATIRGVLSANSLTGGDAAADASAPAADERRDVPRSAVPAAAAGNAPAVPPRSEPAIGARLARERSYAVEIAPAQAAFDRLSADAPQALEEIVVAANRGEPEAGETVGEPVRARSAPAAAPAVLRDLDRQRRPRVEQSLVAEPDPQGAAKAGEGERPELRLRTFESEVDPFELGRLGTGHLVLFRKVWRDSERYIQGVLLDAEQFIDGAIGRAFLPSSLAASGALSVLHRGDVMARLASPGAGMAGELLHRARLSPPYGNVELVFNAGRLPPGPGSALLAWVSVALAATLGGGFLLARQFAVGQIRLARQQQDFVSAVSHELKTPLTSIRMYGEMLQAGWADEARKSVYYDYIRSESERLSRLIDNVLQLARLSRNTARLDPKRVTAAELLDVVRSKVASQIERAGFALEVRNAAPPGTELLVDPDCFTQIVINLVDNALKFAASAERKVVELGCRAEGEGQVLFTVRDFGPGVPKGQMKRIFELFYRPESALTRAAPGTGIGLALVRELANAMGGRVDVRNCEPGAEFRLSLPAA